MDKSDKAYTDLTPINQSLDEMKPSIDKTDSRVKQLIESNVGLSQSTDTAKDQIQQVINKKNFKTLFFSGFKGNS